MPQGFDMNALMQQAQAMQAQVQQAQAELAVTSISGSAGGGLVTVVMTGSGEVTSVSIKPEACDPEDTESLGDLIVAALRDANNQAAALAQQKLGPLAGGMGFGL
ncbi:YbaB/EbfC family nucleoid-associated protein [Raineyella fluvialis]|uniref:Nucleoid-associated protein Rai3103_03370 n=2 Tax=Raineyella fluvialis TaxID=2662261 RepID=A0A5Q2FDM9_9ACTN|nr:YbaB/EbfC family nucleoid-associated protein [Raineyella fluvialis]